jgi:UTP--glucose-1-phosphate uridylyltransferase
MKVRKAIIPAAGMGTRVRDIAGELPKELLSVGGKPLIAHAIEDAATSGVRQIGVVISPAKESIRQFLLGDPPEFLAPLLDTQLKALLRECTFSFFVQPEPSGLADAVSLCRQYVGDEPFVLVMPDNILLDGLPVVSQLIPFFSRNRQDVVGAIVLGPEKNSLFGNVGILATEAIPGEDRRFLQVTGFSDKVSEPLYIHPGTSVLKNFGASIFLPHFFDYIEECRPFAKGELDDVPVVQAILRDKGLGAVVLEGNGFDVGNPAGYLAAQLHASRSSRSNRSNR